ncbi:CHAD domain-containing protein [Mumia sp. ZJ1417]|uniref:CHAD domain-containing protein n=1 Tax=Mumia sp. ZJ1417 TaxID=2708082 RepID=UPI00142472F1|nr:CHAD domain-containing protein [Mumia sp. ZJ1417]QMW66378.1 CHAD domain-containing protein [Mumia sp. ZJ1417]
MSGDDHPDDAGDAVARSLDAIADQLDATLGLAVLDQPDGVHAHRKAVRRLRSTLAAYRPFFDADTVRRLHRTYRDWGRELGEARDLEVRIAVAERFLDDDDDDAAGARMLDELRTAYRDAHRAVARRGVSVEARDRRADLAAFLDAPPRTAKASRRTKRGVRRRIVKEGDRVLRRAAAATSGPGDDVALHELRKAARRLRYAVESVTRPPVGLFGAKADALAVSAEQIHDLLGDVRDLLAFARAYEAAGGVSDGPAARAKVEAAEKLDELPAAVDDLRSALAQFR